MDRERDRQRDHYQAESGKAGVACARALFDADRVTERYERVYQELGGR